MKKGAVWLIAAAFAMSGVVAACGDDDDEGGGGSASSSESSGGEAGKVAVLLPDSKSSVRWETVDRPSLQKAFEDAGVEAEIQNAEGDKATQQQQAEQAITNGAKVILLVNLDSGSGAAIAANAKSQGVKVIDYDRLTLDTQDTDYYVSFDNEAVGKLQAQTLVDTLKSAGKTSGNRVVEKAMEEVRESVKKGGTLRVNLPVTDIDDIDPSIAYGTTTWHIQYSTALKLLTYPDAAAPRGSRLVPEGATSYKVSGGGRVYTFTIRRGFRFSYPG